MLLKNCTKRELFKSRLIISHRRFTVLTLASELVYFIILYTPASDFVFLTLLLNVLLMRSWTSTKW